jgi:Trp operon repressor
MSESDENAQQRSYYSAHRPDSRYWWSIFIFFMKAAVLNAYKLWELLYPDSKMTHLKFQHQIVETLLKSSDQTRQIISTLSITSQNKENSSSTCQWEHMSKLLYCVPCKVQLAESRKRRALSESSPNYTKRRRGPQTTWRCSNCDPCCKKKECWNALHS